MSQNWGIRPGARKPWAVPSSTCPPRLHGARPVPICALTWNSGKPQNIVRPGAMQPSPSTAASWIAFAVSVACVRTAIFGRPVVPPVQKYEATSSTCGASNSRSSSGDAATSLPKSYTESCPTRWGSGCGAIAAAVGRCLSASTAITPRSDATSVAQRLTLSHSGSPAVGACVTSQRALAATRSSRIVAGSSRALIAKAMPAVSAPQIVQCVSGRLGRM